MKRSELVSDDDYVTKASPRSVSDTLDRLLAILDTRQLKCFAVIDQREEARRAGLDLRETILVVFGDPVIGTPVMHARPLAALDLPLKICIWADGDRTNVSYLAPPAFARRHGLSSSDVRDIARIDSLADLLVRPPDSIAR